MPAPVSSLVQPRWNDDDEAGCVSDVDEFKYDYTNDVYAYYVFVLVASCASCVIRPGLNE